MDNTGNSRYGQAKAGSQSHGLAWPEKPPAVGGIAKVAVKSIRVERTWLEVERRPEFI